MKQWKEGRVSLNTLDHDAELMKLTPGRLSFQLPLVQNSIKRSRALAGCKAGDVSLAVNGRPGRRVACVLDNKGTILESFDIEGGTDDDMESDE